MKIENTGSFKENMDSNFSEEKNDKTAEQNDDDQSFNPFYRVIKTYVLRASRMTQAQERDYQDLSPVWCIPFAKSKINFIDIFGNTNPVIVEIGFLAEKAAQQEAADSTSAYGFAGKKTCGRSLSLYGNRLAAVCGKCACRAFRNARTYQQI